MKYYETESDIEARDFLLSLGKAHGMLMKGTELSKRLEEVEKIPASVINDLIEALNRFRTAIDKD